MRGDKAVLAAALIAGSGYYLDHWLDLSGPWMIVWKGLGVGLLALWAAMRARSRDGWLIAAVLAFGALGDVLLEAVNLTVGALAFLIGHVIAIWLYARNRRPGGWWWPIVPALAVSGLASGMPADEAAVPGVALYALGLGGMAGAAWRSRFPAMVTVGAALFVVSDLLIFSRMGPLAASPLPGLLIWPAYFAGQALIAWGVVTGLERR